MIIYLNLICILDLQTDSTSDNYDSAYVNTCAYRNQMSDVQNKDIIENPYYEKISNPKPDTGLNTKISPVNLDDVEVVKCVSIWKRCFESSKII